MKKRNFSMQEMSDSPCHAHVGKQTSDKQNTGHAALEILRDSTLILGERRRSLDPGISSCLNISYHGLVSGTPIRAVAIWSMTWCCIIVNVVRHFLLVVRAWSIRRIRGSFGLMTCRVGRGRVGWPSSDSCGIATIPRQSSSTQSRNAVTAFGMAVHQRVRRITVRRAIW